MEDISGMQLTGIDDPQETDVLCGRGGAALRHPGNQTYRRLVQLNKGLYITCLKAEKLKISRSIVAAIREQQGRFLERNAQDGTWYDIGDKKAMEKTSQALREGQPKLRAKIVELGGGPAGAAALLEAQFPGNTLYNLNQGPHGSNPRIVVPSEMAQAQQQQQQQPSDQPDQPQDDALGMDLNGQILSLSRANSANSVLSAQQIMSLSRGNSNSSMLSAQQQQQQQQQQHQLLYGSGRQQQSSTRSDMSNDLLTRLSFSDVGTIEEEVAAGHGSASTFVNPTLTSRDSQINNNMGMGDPASNLSLMSNFSQFGMSNQGLSQQQMAALTGVSTSDMSIHAAAATAAAQQNSLLAQQLIMQQQQQQQQEGGIQPNEAGSMLPPPSAKQVDRRRMFARMKYRPGASQRPMTASGRSLGDGMPDIHLVESNPSIFSNMSDAKSDIPSETTSIKSGHSKQKKHAPNPDVASVFESRRSLMSGMSRISDTNDTIFSDLSRKIGNVSTRSIAMSEISQMDDAGTTAAHSLDLEVDEHQVDDLVQAGQVRAMDF